MFPTNWCVVMVIPKRGLVISSRHFSKMMAGLIAAPYRQARVMHIDDVTLIQRLYERKAK